MTTTVSVGKIPAKFHAAIIANPEQVRQFADMYGVTIERVEQLAEHPTLVVDTGLFNAEWALELLSDPAFDHLDEQTDGLLIHSENWQALNVLEEKYRERVKCICIDPPYNTGGDGFIYKDSFRHSSWVTMIDDRLKKAVSLLNPEGVVFANIDSIERNSLEKILDDAFGRDNRVEELIWAQNTTHNDSPTYSTNHEYVQVYAKNRTLVEKNPTMFRETKPGFVEIMELVDRLNPQYPAVSEVEKAIKRLMDDHLIEFKDELEVLELTYNEETKKLDPWKGIYNYNNAEYRDSFGRYVTEQEASKQQAKIWVWREDNPSAPAGKQAESTHDPESKNFRFYNPLHPSTGIPCPFPKRGWLWPFLPIDDRQSFTVLDADHRIVYGKDEKKIPQVKKFLHEVETNVSKSIIHDYTDGEKELTAIMGTTNTFPNPKPTTLVERFILQTTGDKEIVLDFFAGSGVTGQATLRTNRKRKYILVEMGTYFNTVLKPRIQKVMYSLNWRDGMPVADQVDGYQGIVKVQRLEQYEDLLANLETAWDGETLPKGLPVQYLFRPEHNKLVASLDLSRPFTQTIKAGKAREEKSIDLMESWLYLQGHWVKSRRLTVENGKKYLAVETTSGVLVIFRDIDTGEDDSAALNAIADRYKGGSGELMVTRLEVNFDTDIRKVKLPMTLVQAADFDRGASWS